MFSLYFATDSAPGCVLPLSFSVFLAAFFAQLTFLKCLVHRRVVYDAAQSPVCWTEGQSSQGTPGACAASNCNCCYHRRGEHKGCCPCAEPEKLVSIADCRLLFFAVFIFCFSPIFLCLFRFFATLGKASKSCKRQQRNADQLSAAHRMPNAFRFCIPCKASRGIYVYVPIGN